MALDLRESLVSRLYLDHFVSGLYLDHLLTNILQTLYRSSYQEGVVWD